MKLLAKQIKQSDKQAFKKLFDELNQDLFNFIYYKTSDEQLAEDILQDTFIKLWQRRHSVDTELSLKSYFIKLQKIYLKINWFS